MNFLYRLVWSGGIGRTRSVLARSLVENVLVGKSTVGATQEDEEERGQGWRCRWTIAGSNPFHPATGSIRQRPDPLVEYRK